LRSVKLAKGPSCASTAAFASIFVITGTLAMTTGIGAFLINRPGDQFNEGIEQFLLFCQKMLRFDHRKHTDQRINQLNFCIFLFIAQHIGIKKQQETHGMIIVGLHRYGDVTHREMR
jgi:hypothetical protein